MSVAIVSGSSGLIGSETVKFLHAKGLDVFGIDNNLDGRIDEANEAGVFAYWGGRDGLDNDLDGYVDQEDVLGGPGAANGTVEYDARLDNPGVALATFFIGPQQRRSGHRPLRQQATRLRDIRSARPVKVGPRVALNLCR